MKRILYLSFFLIMCHGAWGQTTYRIYYGNQLVELVQAADSTYAGKIVCAAYPMHFDDPDIPLLQKSYPIPEATVQKLIEVLQNENIETLPNSRDIKNFGNWVEGETVKFEVITDKGSRSYTYICPNANLWDARFKEIQNVRAILKTLRTELQLGKVFVGYIESLPVASAVSNGDITIASRPPLAMNQGKSTLIYSNVSRLFTIWDESPEFPGGDTALIAFLTKNIKNIELNSMTNNIQMVNASFLVGKDGTITGITSMNDALYTYRNPKNNAEALRVISLMPKWIPGKKDGQTAQVRYSLSIRFKPEL